MRSADRNHTRGPSARSTVRWLLIATSFAAVLAVMGVALFRPRLPSRPSILLISIDTLRADHLGVYGYRGETSPFIDRIAAQGAVFDDVTVPVPATDPSHAALLSGRHPFTTGVLSNAMVLGAEVETVAEVLRAKGYATVGATAVFHLSARYGFDQGFDRFTSVAADRVRRSAAEVNADVRQFIEQHRATGAARPFFAFVHYYDVHYPYINHEDPAQFPGDRTLASTVRAYDSGIRFVDRHVAELWAALQTAGLADNTFIVITADHGEQLGERGVIAAHADIYRETIRAPLIVTGPGVIRRRVPVSVSTMDIGPTVLALAGSSFGGPVDGQSLLPMLRDASQPVERARDLLVAGHPQYARSLALRSGPYFYVRNLEWAYRSIAVERGAPPNRMEGPATHEAASVTDGSVRRFTIPALDVSPYRISAYLHARPGCAAAVTLALPGGVELVRDLSVDAPVQLGYTVARLEPSFLVVSPPTCVERVTWTFARQSAPAAPSPDAAEIPTRLFDTLLTPRKHTTVDELYDLRSDAAMTTDIMASSDPAIIERLRTALDESVAAQQVATTAPVVLSTEQIDQLRSLGYIK